VANQNDQFYRGRIEADRDCSKPPTWIEGRGGEGRRGGMHTPKNWGKRRCFGRIHSTHVCVSVGVLVMKATCPWGFGLAASRRLNLLVASDPADNALLLFELESMEKVGVLGVCSREPWFQFHDGRDYSGSLCFAMGGQDRDTLLLPTSATANSVPPDPKLKPRGRKKVEATVRRRRHTAQGPWGFSNKCTV
jgi:hypothetical protein